MAKYYVTMACGHDEEVVLYGKTEDRERKIKYFESEGLCKECYKKLLAEKQMETIKEIAGELNLAELKGSEKQVAWAEKIRLEILEAVAKEIKNMARNVKNKTEEDKENDKKVIKITFDYLTEQTESTYWIDRRDWTGEQFIRKEIIPVLKEKML